MSKPNLRRDSRAAHAYLAAFLRNRETEIAERIDEDDFYRLWDAVDILDEIFRSTNTKDQT
jgi:hypothetical protein